MRVAAYFDEVSYSSGLFPVEGVDILSAIVAKQNRRVVWRKT